MSLDTLIARCRREGEHLVWTGSCASDARPMLRIGKRYEASVRRIVCEHRYGPLQPGQYACWTCAVPRCIWCVAPMTKRERAELSKARGSYSNPQRIEAVTRTKRATAPKMTLERARAMRERRRQGATFASLAAEFGVHLSLAHRICAGKCWAEPQPPVVVIPRRPGRYEVTGPFERAITADWMLRRQGVDPASHP